MLRDVCMYTMRRILTEQAPYPHRFLTSDKVCIIDGIEILFRSGDQPDSLRGLSLDGFGIDEAREFNTRDIYDIMIGRLSNNTDAQGFITTSPKGKNWVYELESLPNTETIVQTTNENLFLPASYIDSLKSSYTTIFQRQEIDGEIVAIGKGDYFRSHWPKWITTREIPVFEQIIISVDASNKSDPTSCPASIQVWGLKSPNYYMLYDLTTRMGAIETGTAIERLMPLYPAGTILVIEPAANGYYLIERLKKKYPVYIFPVQRFGGKEDRAKIVAPLWETGNVCVIDTKYNREVYYQELMEFPDCQWKDRVDAMSQAIIYFTKCRPTGALWVTGR